MKLNLEHIKVLDAIDRNGSFGAAAEELHKVRTALTYMVNKLERDLDIKVFDRSGHRAVLTQTGKLFLEQGRHLLEQAFSLEQAIKNIKQGWEPKLRIAFDDTLDKEKLMHLFHKFYKECPNTELVIRSEILGGCWDALESNEVDLAIGTNVLAPKSAEIVTADLGMLEFLFCVSPKHPLAKATEPITNKERLKHTAIIVADSAKNPLPHHYGVLSGQKQFVVSSLEQKVLAQIEGIGVGFLPKTYARIPILTNKLLPKKVEKEKGKVHLYCAWHANKKSGMAMQWFIKHFKKTIKLTE